MPLPPDISRSQSFNAAARQYAANRPSYPPSVLDAIEEIWRSLAGAQVADIGAGTGIATALLLERHADVIAVEPGAEMAAELRRALPQVPLVRGDGNALPLADASRDLLTYAQSWHWTDPRLSLPEALRVLRPSGALALWWNTEAVDTPWSIAQKSRIAQLCGTPPKTGKRPDDHRAAALAGISGLPFTRRLLRWSRTVPIEVHLANISTHSALLTLDTATTSTFLASEHALLQQTFPHGTLQESYVVDLLLIPHPQ